MKTRNSKKSLGMTALIAMAVMDFVLLALFVYGSGHCFGTRTGVINILYFFINIVGTARAEALRNVTCLVVGVVWVLFVILMLKHIITNLRDLVKINKVKNINCEQFDYFRDVTSPFFLTIVFLFLCNLMDKASVDWYVMVALGVNLLVKMGATCYRLYCYTGLGKDATVRKDYYVACTIRLAMLTVSVLYLTNYAYRSYGGELYSAYYALSAISKSMDAIAIVQLIYNNVVDCLLRLFVALNVLILFALYERRFPGKDKDVFAKTELRLLIPTALLLLVNAILPFLTKDGLKLPETNALLNAVFARTADWYLPMFALSLVLTLTAKVRIKPVLAKPKKKAKEQEENVEAQAQGEEEQGATENSISVGDVNVPNCGYDFEVWKLTLANTKAMCGTCGQPLQVYHTRQESYALACSSMGQGKSCGEKAISVNSLAKQFASWQEMLYGQAPQTIDLDEMTKMIDGLSLHESKVQFFLRRK